MRAMARRNIARNQSESVEDTRRYVFLVLSVLSRLCVQIFLRTAGLTDYEVRDLNDEINKLMREKRHWENQIIALGGANYRRNVAMLDDDGREVPGTKGYKCANTFPISFFSFSILNHLKILWSSQGVAGCQRTL
jgi:pre-mRNA-splicing factor ISY1